MSSNYAQILTLVRNIANAFNSAWTAFFAFRRYLRCIFFFSSESPSPADQENNTHQIVSVRCLGNGSASVSYNLSDSGYVCPALRAGDRVKIQIDYVCYGATHPVMVGCNCRFESCMQQQSGVVRIPSIRNVYV